MKLFVSVKRSNCADKECTELFSYQKKIMEKVMGETKYKNIKLPISGLARVLYITHFSFKERESRVCFKRPIYNKLAPYFCDESQNCYARARSFNEELKLARRSRK